MSHDEDRTQAFAGMAGTRVGKYTILNRIGAGGMGEVFLAEDVSLKRMAAIKFLPAHLAADPELRARFTREAQAAAALNHPNVVHVYEVGEHEGLPYFVMEHVDGPSLRDRLRQEQEKPSDLADLLRIVQQLAEGLAEAHGRGIIHRDVKPGNVVFDRAGRPKLLDFGLAGMSGQEQLTQAGSTLGTVGYMAPEQIRGRQTDPRADLFSLGVVLYELLAGRPPFQKDTEAATIQAILNTAPEPIARYRSNLPEGAQHIVDRLLEKDPEVRYQSAADAAADLRREIRVLDGDTGPVSTRRPAASPGAGRSRVWIPAAALAVALAALLLVRPWGGGDPTGGPTPARADVNRLAVLYFDNIAEPGDPQRLGEIVTNLLITGMSESPGIQVVSSQRLYDILKQMGREGEKSIPSEMATEVARRAGARWMLTGSILRVRPLVITTQLVEVDGGDVVASDRTQADPGEDVFPVADRMTAQIRSELNLAPAATGGSPTNLGDATTHSPEAYALYLEGQEWSRKYYPDRAESVLTRALEIDPGFAVAYNDLSILSLRWGDPGDAVRYSRLAMDNIAGTAWKDSMSIVAMSLNLAGDVEGAGGTVEEMLVRDPLDKDSWFILGILNRFWNEPRAIACWERCVELDPGFGEALNQLAYAYVRRGDDELANRTIARYVALSPDEPNPYDSQGDIFVYQGRLEEGVASYRRALEIEPAFFPSWLKLGAALCYLRRYDEAEATFDIMARAEAFNIPSDPVIFKVLVDCWRGRFQNALRRLDAAEGRPEQARERAYMRAFLLTAVGRHDEAVAAAEEAIARWPDLEFMSYSVETFARPGSMDRAEKLVAELEAMAAANPGEGPAYVAGARGDLAHARGDHERAAALYTEAENTGVGFSTFVLSGREYLHAGKFETALPLLERAVRTHDEDRFWSAPENVRVHFHLARCYEETGRTAEAADSYRRFLDIWRDADSALPEIEEARARLAALGG